MREREYELAAGCLACEAERTVEPVDVAALELLILARELSTSSLTSTAYVPRRTSVASTGSTDTTKRHGSSLRGSVRKAESKDAMQTMPKVSSAEPEPETLGSAASESTQSR